MREDRLPDELGARALRAAIRVEGEDEALVRSAWLQVLTREPTTEEARLAVQFLARQTGNTGGREAAVAELVRGLLNLNEFLYVD